MNSNIFDRLSFIALFAVLVLLPVFCLPFTNIPVETSKGLLLVLGLSMSVIFWAISRFIDGKIVLPKSPLLVAGGAVVLTVLLSALFSGNLKVTLFGTMFDVGSFWFILAGFLLMFYSAIIFKTPKRAKIVIFGIILSSAVVLIFQTLHLFMPSILSLGILNGKTANLLGSWNALGLFAGFAGLMFLLVMEFFQISRLEKIVLMAFTVLAILLAVTVNFPLVWILLGLSSLIIFVYKVSRNFQVGEGEEAEGHKKNFPLTSFVIAIICLLFFMSGQFIGGYIPSRLGISNAEVGPSLGTTMYVTKQVLKSSPVFGIGANRFEEAWSMHKPESINNTQFWNISFNSGSGLFPTLFTTTGGLSILAWLAFLVLFIAFGVKSLFASIKNGTNWEMMSFFILSLYLFISSFFYATGIVVFLLALAFSGIFVGLVTSGSGKELTISFLNDHRKSFFSILGLIVIVVFFVATSFKYVERLTSVWYFGKALAAETVPLAENYIGKALTLYSNDLYLRTYSQIYLVKLNSILAKGSNLSDAEKAELQSSFDQAVSSAQLAASYDSKNYVNFQLLGSIYQTAGALGVKDAYSESVIAYQKASVLNPLNPGIKLSIASSQFSDKKVEDARNSALAALALKPDYIEALLTLAQIEKSAGNNAKAISYAEQALALSPTSEELIKYVNSLKNPSQTSTSTQTTTENPKN